MIPDLHFGQSQEGSPPVRCLCILPRLHGRSDHRKPDSGGCRRWVQHRRQARGRRDRLWVIPWPPASASGSGSCWTRWSRATYWLSPSSIVWGATPWTRATVEGLQGLGIRVHCLALGGMDLTSPAGRTMQVIAAVAEFERDLLIERTQAGLARAKAEQRRGPALSFSARRPRRCEAKLAAGHAVAALAREYGTSRQTIMRVRDAGLVLQAA